jgi:hypothetical protein
VIRHDVGATSSPRIALRRLGIDTYKEHIVASGTAEISGRNAHALLRRGEESDAICDVEVTVGLQFRDSHVFAPELGPFGILQLKY